MSLQVTGQVGEINVAGGAAASAIRQGNQGDVIISELNGRFYEQNARGRTYSGGMSLTAINAATWTSATLGATCTPIAGIWNPTGSGLNAEILQAVMTIALTVAGAVTGGGPYVWAVSAGNSLAVPSTGLKPWNRKTLQQNGSVMFNMAGVALTGLTNNLTVIGASALGGGSAYNVTATDTGFAATLPGGFENIDGSFIVPPGGILALLATTTPVGHSAASLLLWNEVPPST